LPGFKGVELVKTQTPYPDEYRRRMVELLGLHRTRDKLNTEGVGKASSEERIVNK
jgi:hypothetical protein